MPVLDVIAWLLLVLWAILLIGALLLRRFRPHMRRLPAWMQAASGLTLLLLVWYGFLLARPGTETARYAFGIATATVLILVGGHLAAGALAPKRTWFGISATAIGYLLIVAAITQYGPALEGVRLLVLSLSLLVGALAGLAFLLRTRHRHPVQTTAAVAYTLLLLFAAVGLAFGLALTAPRFGILPAGLLLLVFSDLTRLIELADSPSLFPHLWQSQADPRSRPLPQ
ncbi:MAG: hypothetical protein F4148_04930, partial [Caldilineaceae bacterium SB0675_bin_29]|nr:hypothetical protein [Caldilineaceae bacterium SB0675_bin_29]